jgi:hypothetical protein
MIAMTANANPTHMTDANRGSRSRGKTAVNSTPTPPENSMWRRSP